MSKRAPDWVRPIVEVLLPHVALLVLRWPDEDERVFLARELPKSRGYVVHLEPGPAGPRLMFAFDLTSFGRGVVEAVSIPIGNEPGDLPFDLFPPDARAALARMATAAAARLPAVPDTVGELLGGAWSSGEADPQGA